MYVSNHGVRITTLRTDYDALHHAPFGAICRAPAPSVRVFLVATVIPYTEEEASNAGGDPTLCPRISEAPRDNKYVQFDESPMETHQGHRSGDSCESLEADQLKMLQYSCFERA